LTKIFGSICLFFLGLQAGFSQQKTPVLLSDSTSVKIEIDGKQVAVWNIDPDTKPWTEPDVFTLERSFHEQRVVYLSNRDSLSFVLHPGDKYDFSIKMTKRGSFPMRIATFDEPVFLHKEVMIPVILGILLIFSMALARTRVISTISLLWTGILSPLFFWIITIAGGFLHGDYNHLHNVVSELGAIGTRSEIFMSATEILVALLSVFSVFGFYNACRQVGLKAIPIFSLLSLSISMFWAAIFPMHHAFHGMLGPIPLLMNVGVLLAIFLWKGKQWFGIRLLSIISFILMSFIMLRFIPNLRGDYEGLIQRFFYMGWSVWSIGLSLCFLRIMKKEFQANFISSTLSV